MNVGRMISEVRLLGALTGDDQLLRDLGRDFTHLPRDPRRVVLAAVSAADRYPGYAENLRLASTRVLDAARGRAENLEPIVRWRLANEVFGTWHQLHGILKIFAREQPRLRRVLDQLDRKGSMSRRTGWLFKRIVDMEEEKEEEEEESTEKTEGIGLLFDALANLVQATLDGMGTTAPTHDCDAKLHRITEIAQDELSSTQTD